MAKLTQLCVECCCEFSAQAYGPKKTFDSWNEALAFYGEMHFPDAYECSLRREFVVAEMGSLVESGRLFREKRLDLLSAYRLHAAKAAAEAGLADALVRIILHQPNSGTSLKATLLLSDLQLAVAEHFANTEGRYTNLRELNEACSDEVRRGNALLLLSRLDQLKRVTARRQQQNPLHELDGISSFFLPVRMQAKRPSLSGEG